MELNNIANILEFSRLSITEQSAKIAKSLCNDLKVTVNNHCYVWNGETKLWELHYAMFTFLTQFMDKKANEMNQILVQQNIARYCLCEKRTKKCNICEGAIVTRLITLFDDKMYLKDILERMKGLLIDSNVHTKFDNMHDDFLSIKDGKKINLKTKEVSDRVREDYYTMFCNVSCVDETKHAERFFTSLMPDEINRQYLKKVLGYILTGDTRARVYFVWYGIGANGKSMIAQVIQKILSKYFHTCDKSIFCKFDKEFKGCTPEICDLLGKRCVLYSEGETSDKIELNMSTIKQISGEDEIHGNPKYKETIRFKPICKLNLLTNYVPKIDGSKASSDRLRVLFFDQTFSSTPQKGERKIDKQFTDDILEKYIDEVFSWIIDGSVDYYSDRTITPPKDFLDRTLKLVEEEDAITSFFKYKLQFTDDKNDYIKKAELFEYFKKYCNDNSHRCDPRSQLYSRLAHLKHLTVKLNGYDVYRQMKIIQNEQEKQENDFDFIDEEDEKIIRVTDGNQETIAIEEYQKVLNELELLKKQLKSSGTSKSKHKKVEKKTKPKVVIIDNEEDDTDDDLANDVLVTLDLFS